MASDSFPVARDLSHLESTTALAAVTADKLEHAGAEAASAFEHSVDLAETADRGDPQSAVADHDRVAEATREGRVAPALTSVGRDVEDARVEAAPADAPLRADAAPATATVDALADFNLKALAAMRANLAATMSFWTAMTGARTLSEAVALNASHMRKQIETMTAQGRELSALARTLWADAARTSVGPTDRR